MPVPRLPSGLVELRGPDVSTPSDSVGAYDRLHSAGGLRQAESFYRWMLGLARAAPGDTLLDVSCGQGGLLRCAQRSTLRTAGVDLSAPAVRTAARQASLALLAVADAERLPYPDNSFTRVTNVGSVEHYFDPACAVREMARVLRPDGLAVVLLPNTFGLLGNILHVWRTGDLFDDGQPLQRYGTLAQWRRLLEQNGLAVTRVVRYERAWPRTGADLRWALRRPYRLLRSLATPLIPLSLSSFLVFLCRKSL